MFEQFDDMLFYMCIVLIFKKAFEGEIKSKMRQKVEDTSGGLMESF